MHGLVICAFKTYLQLHMFEWIKTFKWVFLFGIQRLVLEDKVRGSVFHNKTLETKSFFAEIKYVPDIFMIQDTENSYEVHFWIKTNGMEKVS